MKRFNINLKDRKTLSLLLCLVLISVFTLTVAYSALSAVLTISGNARVSAADWDIYLDNPRVTNGSATTNVPIVNGVTATFNTTLNMPGDFFEFVVDVVNDGSIDAMIENVVKTPDLTAEQAKFLKYEITYQNGESISTKQTLSKGTAMPIKVRIEYRNDLVASDLPTGQVVLDLSLTLEYIQSDGTGSSVNNNGVAAKLAFADGDINEIGTIVTIGTEQFYTIGTEGNNVKLLSMYNLYVGGGYDNVHVNLSSQDDNMTASKLNYVLEDVQVQQLAGEMPYYQPFKSPTGKQDSRMKGYVSSGTPYYGVTAYSNVNHEYVGSLVEGYVNNYKNILENDYGVPVVEARLITKDELEDSNTFACEYWGTCPNKYPWIYATSYWVMTVAMENNIMYIASNNEYFFASYDNNSHYGVRPVIVISKDLF